MKPIAAALCLVSLVGMQSCALFIKAPPVQIRYFSPELQRESQTKNSLADLRLRLGSIAAARHLDSRMAFRVQDQELGYHETSRWTEMPEDYLRRAVARELFEVRGAHRVFSGEAATLDIELTAFEEIEEKPQRVRLSLSYELHTDRESLLVDSLTIELPLGEREPDASQRVAAKLGETLIQGVQVMSERIAVQLRSSENAAISARQDQRQGAARQNLAARGTEETVERAAHLGESLPARNE